MVRAWYLNDCVDSDQRLAHQRTPGEFLKLERLSDLGVLYWKFDPQTYREDPKFEAIRKERRYAFEDIVTVSRETLPNYDAKLIEFYIEHFHGFEEVRFVLEGSGYFDVKDEENKWIRIEVQVGDFVSMPPGIIHRFTLDLNDYIKALRLFVGGANAPHLHLPEDEKLECRQNYLRFLAARKA